MKKLFNVLLVTILTLAVAACGSAANETGKDGDAGGNQGAKEPVKKEPVKLTVGASAVPHAEILEHIKPALEKEGIALDVKVFQDYVLPNKTLAEGELDANYFQHKPWMETANEENGWKLVDAVGVHIEPIGAYSETHDSVDNIPDGATVAIPNATAETHRVLLLLEANGLIKLKAGDGNKKLADIAENPKNLKFKEVENAMLPRTLQDVDFAVINTNYALQADLNPTKDALFIEDARSPYVNVLAVNAGDEKKPEIETLVKVLTSDDVKKFIEEKYEGAVVPAFTNK
ncbi:MetQ/NlpA family ABC transporter substrate-binding protein [Numidum massiliense]|uniref:MetQ/NlpA family ABC transporter substrate-binding protein n=1 Tax=Numidum massiliense TaxID=1522315 RepID=UPI0006D56EE6|nr:MetQ/NlpA family ABC transporter substrate-binding protein [Numidum massiliense]